MNFSPRAVKSSLLLAGSERCEALGEESSQNRLHSLDPGGCGSLWGIDTRCWCALASAAAVGSSTVSASVSCFYWRHQGLGLLLAEGQPEWLRAGIIRVLSRLGVSSSAFILRQTVMPVHPLQLSLSCAGCMSLQIPC